MEPSNNQLPQNPPNPNSNQPQNVITPQQSVQSNDRQQGLGTVNNPTQVPGVPMGPGMVQQGAPAQYAQPNLQQPQQPFMQSSSPMPSGGSKKKSILIALALVVGIALLAGGAFFLMQKPSGNNSNANKAAQESSKLAGAQTKDMATLQSVAFVSPSDMSAYGSNLTTKAGGYSYLTKTSTEAKKCGLSFGVHSATDLPGADINEIIKPQTDKLKSQGVTVSGPTAGAALVVKDAEGTASYSMPSLTFSLVKGSQHETDHYSIAVLASGQRAVVVRSCADTTSPIDQPALDALEATAKNITIKTQ